jgi:hypothetical protein
MREHEEGKETKPLTSIKILLLWKNRIQLVRLLQLGKRHHAQARSKKWPDKRLVSLPQFRKRHRTHATR